MPNFVNYLSMWTSNNIKTALIKHITVLIRFIKIGRNNNKIYSKVISLKVGLGKQEFEGKKPRLGMPGK